MRPDQEQCNRMLSHHNLVLWLLKTVVGMQIDLSHDMRFPTMWYVPPDQEQCDRMLSHHNLVLWLLKTVVGMQIDLSHDMRFPTMWYVRPAKPLISLRIRAV